MSVERYGYLEENKGARGIEGTLETSKGCKIVLSEHLAFA